MTAILRYDAACHAIAEAKTIDEVSDWIDKAAAVREYGRRIKNRKLELDAIEIRVQAKRRRGELLLAMRASGELRDGKPSSADDGSPRRTLADLDVTPNESSEDQAIAQIDGDSFARLVARCRSYAESHPEKHSINVLKPPPEGPISGARSVMGSRQEPDDSLDFFPTPLWATRALLERIFPVLAILPAPALLGDVWEPACGAGHMAEVLREYSTNVWATDIFDYGYQDAIENFLDPRQDRTPDWIITNPPFKPAEDFALQALKLANVGVAMFVRWQWLESVGRYERLFSPFPPTLVCPFAERVPLHKGRWETKGSTATAYCWIVWHKPLSTAAASSRVFWIPPGCRVALSKPSDAERFGADAESELPPHDPDTGEIQEPEAQRDDTALTAAPASMDDESTASAMSPCTHGDGAAVRTMSPKPPQNSEDEGIPDFCLVENRGKSIAEIRSK